jgi:hypothetical protein
MKGCTFASSSNMAMIILLFCTKLLTCSFTSENAADPSVD